MEVNNSWVNASKLAVFEGCRAKGEKRPPGWKKVGFWVDFRGAGGADLEGSGLERMLGDGYFRSDYFNSDEKSAGGRSAIDNSRLSQPILTAGFVNMAADDDIRLVHVDKIADGPASDVNAAVNNVGPGIERRGMGDENLDGRTCDLFEARRNAPA